MTPCSALLIKFLSRIERRGGHWIWTGSCHRGVPVLSYRRVDGGQVRTYATRYSVQAQTGRAPRRGSMVLRTCDVPGCVRHVVTMSRAAMCRQIAGGRRVRT